MKDRTATVNRQKTVRHKRLKRQLKQRLTQIDRQIGAIDEAVGKRMASDDGLARKSEVLTSIPGIGAVTAAGLLTELPELGQIDGKAIASLTGLAPMTCQSGQWKGHRFIRSGRARPRRMLYMAALSAIQHHPELSSKYADLKKRGKPSKLALTVIMRKRIVLANALVKQDRRWTPAAA